MQTLISIGVAQIGISFNPDIMRTILGSCIGICIYDRIKKIGGMAHILLPNEIQKGHPEKYADTAIPLLVESLLKKGCQREFMSAKIAGGATMFRFKSNLMLGQIGERNISESKRTLEKIGIPLVAEDTGGNVGRVIDFFLEDGRLKIKASGEERILYKV
jgi:chemotaxis protein CheD